MPTISPKVTPYYGGGQVVNPANVIQVVGAPSTHAISNSLGTLAVDNTNQNVYCLTSVSGGTATWSILGGTSAGTFSGLTGDNSGTATPNPAITVAGTANQITTSGASHTLTLTLPSAITAPGSLTTTTTLASGTSLTAGTTFTATGGASTFVGTFHANVTGAATSVIGTGGTGAVQIGNATGNTAVTGSLTASTTLTATLGAITATNGNLNLASTGNKILMHATTAASDAIGTTAAMTAGSITVSTTAVTANSKIFLQAVTPGGTQGVLSYGTIIAGTSFVITSSSGSDTSTVAYLIIN